jgi:catechol 2,3-dioxygenase-like lactoylglutathione lyase family enzyme
MSLKLNHVHLKTKDPEKTAKFYVDTLGATIVNKASNGSYRLDLHGLSLNVTTFIESQTREQKYGMNTSLSTPMSWMPWWQSSKPRVSTFWSKPRFPAGGGYASSRDQTACSSSSSR